METELTKQIKYAACSYKPKMSTGQVGRTIRYATEVWTPNGIVDAIRFEDYVKNRKDRCELVHYEEFSADINHTNEIMGHELGKCKVAGLNYPNENCNGCFSLKRGIPEVGMMITAYEVKITKSDFKSKNGHNIDDQRRPIGNENYYCMPKELTPQVEKLIPEHCGILVWTGNGLRKYRDSMWLDVPDETKIQLLYNALKKWCDRAEE